MVGGPLTKKQLERVHEEQTKVVERLKELIKMPEVKDMLPGATIEISRGLLLAKGGYLCTFSQGGVTCADYGEWSDDSWPDEGKPTRELVEKFDISLRDIEHVMRGLQT